MVPFDRDIATFCFGNKSINQDWLGTKLVATVNHRDMLSNIGEIKRLFYGGVAAADHADVLPFVEKSIAGRTP